MLIDNRRAQHDNTAMQPGPSGTPSTPAFRSSIPSYAAPDRAAWTAKYGAACAPYELTDLPAKFASRARAACGRDFGTIDFVPAVNAHADLDEINQDVAAFIPAAEEDTAKVPLVFFDPQTNSFWAYPQ